MILVRGGASFRTVARQQRSSRTAPPRAQRAMASPPPRPSRLAYPPPPKPSSPAASLSGSSSGSSSRSGGAAGGASSRAPRRIEDAAAPPSAFPLPDAHCHPQLDPPHVAATLQLSTPCLAAMSVGADVDWERMVALAALGGARVIPGFGIHPWWAHMHASGQGTSFDTLLEAPTPEDLSTALHALSLGAGAPPPTPPPQPPAPPQGGAAAAGAVGVMGQGERTREGEGQGDREGGTGREGGESGERGEGGGGGEGRAAEQQQQPLRVVPAAEWQGRLRALLLSHPAAIVGEVGIDRAATVPGTRARTRLTHQLELLRWQVAAAAGAGRPVSVHCVRGYGHLLELFSGLAPAECPPKVMLHSYSGSPEEVARFIRLKGTGERFWFSFSAAIVARTAPAKVCARIRAVPDDRLLLETDQVTPLAVDEGVAASLALLADAKGWGLPHAARVLGANFEAFYKEQLRVLRR